MVAVTCDYVWIDGKSNMRSKIRVLNLPTEVANNITLEDVLEWNFDGSSTHQATGTDSEIVLKPCAIFNTRPSITGVFENSYLKHVLVLCDTYLPTGNACPSNHRVYAKSMFDQALNEQPWFGLEQEYFILDSNTMKPLGFPSDNDTKGQGQYYCSVGANNAFGRIIAEEHLSCCIRAGITISGINAEVAPGQWEFQIGPCVGIDQGDHLWMARYLLHKVAEKHGVVIELHPKPIAGDWNGSGCHTNYSTENMRNGTDGKSGLEYINEAIEKLSRSHAAHMEVYGVDNDLRMTGAHETASFHDFTDGIANRGASVRRGHDTIKNKRGYFEDRRPASNCDPYLVTGKMFETTILS